jgi:hypothetical protein
MSWGEIYNTSWWGVAIDTARTVKARPDFFGSQLNLLTSEQPNLVVNGDFATDSDWGKQSNWTIANGSANSNGSGLIYQTSVSYVDGKIYKVTFDASITSGSGTVRLGNTTSPTPFTNGANEFYLQTDASNTTKYIFFQGISLVGSIDNVSVKVARADLDQIEAKKCVADWIHTTALKDLNN